MTLIKQTDFDTLKEVHLLDKAEETYKGWWVNTMFETNGKSHNGKLRHLTETAAKSRWLKGLANSDDRTLFIGADGSRLRKHDISHTIQMPIGDR